MGKPVACGRAVHAQSRQGMGKAVAVGAVHGGEKHGAAARAGVRWLAGAALAGVRWLVCMSCRTKRTKWCQHYGAAVEGWRTLLVHERLSVSVCVCTHTRACARRAVQVVFHAWTRGRPKSKY